MDKKARMHKFLEKAKPYLKNKKKLSITIAIILFLLIIYGFSRYSETRVEVFHKVNDANFKNSNIMEKTGKTIYQRKEKIYNKKLSEVEQRFKNLDDKLSTLTESIQELKKSISEKPPVETLATSEQQVDQPPSNSTPPPNPALSNDIQFSTPPNQVYAQRVQQESASHYVERPNYVQPPPRQRGSEIISFPVQEKKRSTEMGVNLPAGSYLKAKLLTGVQAPEGKTLPVLLQADYAFVGPNQTRIDLTGCFLIAKSTGNLSIERVELQATKISCVSKSGQMFERDLNGFVADAKDNSFAVSGVVSSKQDRVAAMAFLSSVVEGVGKAIQQSQTTTQVSGANGSTQSMVTGDDGKYIAAGGASQAASRVTDWYLKHAENLLPTIKIGSGQDLFIITQESVELPNWYFKKDPKKPATSSKGTSYLNRFYE